MAKLKALFLAANPGDTTKLALDQEIRQITQKIRLSDGRDALEVVSEWAVQPGDLLQYLNQYKPQIVHFSGHGTAAGEIVLVDRAGAAKSVSARALKSLFSTLKDNIQLVVLNACYSRAQGAAISEVIDFVIGMNDAIGDHAATVFAASLYSALGFNRTIGEAFEQAKTALLLEGIPEENTPELLVQPGASLHRTLGPPAESTAKQRLPKSNQGAAPPDHGGVASPAAPAAARPPAPAAAPSSSARRTCPSPPRALKDAMAQKKVVPFIGAGLSGAVKLPDGRQLPDARELAEGLRELVLAERFPASIRGPNWDVFETYLRAGRAREAISEVLRAFPSRAGTKPNDFNIGLKNRWFRELLAAAATIPPTSHHDMLNMLPFPFFMTVNYDRVLEQSLYPQPEVVTFREPSLVPLFLSANQRFLFKLHGDITRVHEVVEALETWDRFYDEGRPEAKFFVDQITRIFKEYTVLFLGCSFANEEYDKLPEFLGRALSGNDRVHFALVPTGSQPRESLANGHIQFLEYSADEEHSQVWEFLTQIAPSQKFDPVFGKSRQAFFTEEQRADYLEQQRVIEARAMGIRYLTPSMTNALATEEYIQKKCRQKLEQARGDLPPEHDFEDWQNKVCDQMVARRDGLLARLAGGCEVRVLCELGTCEADALLDDPIVKQRYREIINLKKERKNDLEIRLAPAPFKNRKVQSFASMVCPAPDGSTDVSTAFAAQSTADPSFHMVVNMIHYNTSFAESRLVLFEREWVQAMDEAESFATLEELFPE